MSEQGYWNILVRLPTDYRDYGGEVQRWDHPEEYYPDCSSGCRWWRPLGKDLGTDWGICTRPGSPRAGLLTFEHQAGYRCFEN